MQFTYNYKETATDYYPFGMQMPGRTFTQAGTNYRYGFNGKELDKEASTTTTYDYGFRIYSPALGKFLSVDPLTKKYPELTPYQFASNTPIGAIDLDGLESKIVHQYYAKSKSLGVTQIPVTKDGLVLMNSSTVTDNNSYNLGEGTLYIYTYDRTSYVGNKKNDNGSSITYQYVPAPSSTKTKSTLRKLLDKIEGTGEPTVQEFGFTFTGLSNGITVDFGFKAKKTEFLDISALVSAVGLMRGFADPQSLSDFMIDKNFKNAFEALSNAVSSADAFDAAEELKHAYTDYEKSKLYQKMNPNNKTKKGEYEKDCDSCGNCGTLNKKGEQVGHTATQPAKEAHVIY